MSWKNFVSLQASSGEHNNLGHTRSCGNEQDNSTSFLLLFLRDMKIWEEIFLQRRAFEVSWS